MDMRQFSDALRLDRTGIWLGSTTRAVAYPADGNDVCFPVEDTSFWFRHRNDCIAAVVKRFPPAGAIIDVGGGNGYVARRLVDEGYATIVLEPGPAGAWNARNRRHIEDVICTTLEDAAFRPSSVAAVGLFDVLEHIKDDRGVVDLLQTVLQPGGLAYINVPSHEWLWSVSDNDAHHHRRYNLRQIVGLFGAAFRIEYFTYLFSVLTVPTWLRRALPWRLGLVRTKSLGTYEAEHTCEIGPAATVLARRLAAEVRAIDAGRSRSWGTSCLLVVRKP